MDSGHSRDSWRDYSDGAGGGDTVEEGDGGGAGLNGVVGEGVRLRGLRGGGVRVYGKRDINIIDSPLFAGLRKLI